MKLDLKLTKKQVDIDPGTYVFRLVTIPFDEYGEPECTTTFRFRFRTEEEVLEAVLLCEDILLAIDYDDMMDLQRAVDAFNATYRARQLKWPTSSKKKTHAMVEEYDISYFDENLDEHFVDIVNIDEIKEYIVEQNTERYAEEDRKEIEEDLQRDLAEYERLKRKLGK